MTEPFDRYASGDTNKLTEEERWLLKYSQPAKVKVIGVSDTVGSVRLGIFRGISRSILDYLQTGLRIHILNGYHALAIDEHRNDFAPTLWDVHHPKDPKAVIAQPPRSPALSGAGLWVLMQMEGVAIRLIFWPRLRCAG